MLKAAQAKTNTASTFCKPRSFTFGIPAMVFTQAKVRSMHGRAY
jgi:hypothetical protein